MTRTPIQYEYPPFTLRSNVLFFHDWRYVHHGITRWTTSTGGPIERYSDEPLPDVVKWRGSDIPSGIRLRTIPAQKSEPFLRADSPWEEHLRHATMIRDGGTYRLWYDTKSLGCYAESDDGTTWRKPALGLREFDGNRANNILWGENLPPEPDYIGAGCVFIDPSAPAQQRYKSFHNRHIDADIFEKFRRRYPEDTSPRAHLAIERGKRTLAQAGATSPDGIHWTPFDLPLVVHGSDTQNVAYFDETLGKYVGYFRTHVFRRRSIGRAETEDFRHFPLPDTIVWPDAGIGPADVWYANGRTSYPGAPDYHLMFSRKWRVSEDRWSIHLATSPDGVLWSFPPDSQVLAPGNHGEWDAGGSAVGPGMVKLPGNRVGVPMIGYAVPHKFPRRKPLGEIAWATWQKGRLVALVADEHGSFRTPALLFDGNTMRVNVSTKHVGALRVEVVGDDGAPIPGHTLDDCDPISGDYLDHRVTWRGDPTISREDHRPVSFRIQLSHGELFGFTFR